MGRSSPRPGSSPSHPLGSLTAVLLALDLDGVVCDLTTAVAARVRARFGVIVTAASWASYDLSHLGLPPAELRSFLDETFLDPTIYDDAPVVGGAGAALGGLVARGWSIVAVTARPEPLADVTRRWLRRSGLPVSDVRHAPFLGKAGVAAELGCAAAIEDHPQEADLLGEVCDAWLFDRPWNAAHTPARSRRLRGWHEVPARFTRPLERRAS